MRVAVIGSRSVSVCNLGDYLPGDITAIITGGAKGVDASARTWAQEHQVELVEILPDYARYGRSAPLKRNLEIIEASDLVLAFWDGKSRGTAFVIDRCWERGVPCRVHMRKPGSP